MSDISPATDGVYRLSFDGHVLRRGFWLYVWRVTSGERTVLYVGRTGDSSSNKASSPFVRIGRHLDLKPEAKSNTLKRRLVEQGFDPVDCQFQFVAFGPLFSQQSSTTAHRKLRDRTGALEAMLANELRDRNYEVMGIHSSKTTPLLEDVTRIKHFLDAEFPRFKQDD